MPTLVAVTCKEASCGKGAANLASINEPATGLDAASQERVWSASDPDALTAGGVQYRAAVLTVNRQRLFVVDVLACGDGREAHLSVGVRRCQVQHDVHIRVGQQLLHRAILRHSVCLNSALGPVYVDIRACHNLQARIQRQVLQVLRADGPASDDAHTDGIVFLCRHRLAHSIPRRVISITSGTSKSSSLWPSEKKNTRPSPQRRFQTTGITQPLIHGYGYGAMPPIR